jgi:photosystem II stability/assembly factor-like uncharacterized protein
MAKRVTKRPVRKNKVASKDNASSDTLEKATGRVAVNRPSLRMRWTEGNLSFETQTPSWSGEQRAALRPAALRQIGTVATSGAPPTRSSNWTHLGPMAIPNGQTQAGSAARVLVSGRVTAIAIDPTEPDSIYLGTAQGGIWKSTDNGTTWEPKTDNQVSLAIGALALDPSCPRIVYAGTGEGNFGIDCYYGAGILKSIDGGCHWANLASTTFLGKRFSRLVVDSSSGTPAKRLFAATDNGLYRSTDGGVCWKPLTSGLPAAAPASDVLLDAATNTVYVALYRKGIYKSPNADADTPTFAQLTSGLPDASEVTRIALGMSATNPQTVFALMANGPPKYPTYPIDKFYVTTNGGMSWTAIALPTDFTKNEEQGFYNLAVNVDPTTPDIVYLSGISLWQAVKSGSTWTIVDIGSQFHYDNHALAFRPGDHQKLWAGSDGGIYKSVNSGTTWDDSVNKGLCITQLEFIDQHPSSPAAVFAGTQDNGTEQYRGSPVFTHADDRDGGFVVVNQKDPTHVVHMYTYPPAGHRRSPTRSTQGGKLQSWVPVDSGVSGTDHSLFYPPLTACRTNAAALALGTNLVNIDPAEGTGGWTNKVVLPGLDSDEHVSALSYVSDNLIYAGTDKGKVYRLALETEWMATLISRTPLPIGVLWDVSPLPDNNSTVIVVLGHTLNLGPATITPHVWRGVPAMGPDWDWSDISGDLPEIPVNALAIDPCNSNRMFIGTDIGVFETRNAGKKWSFSEGLPYCAVFDLRLHEETRILRAATHGRGLWEKPIDARPTAVDIYVRGHVMDTARVFPRLNGVPAVFEDPLRYVALGDPQYLWMCADIKIDALEGTIPSYQMAVADVDYVAFESKLQDRQPRRTKLNRVYVQLYNRGHRSALDVKVKLLWADVSAGLPSLPPDFWTAFPGNSTNTAQWQPVGAAQTIASFKPTIPVVLEWDWTPPATAAEHCSMVVVMDSKSDAIPAANKVFDISTLVGIEKRAGWKRLQIIDTPAIPL